MTDVEVTVENDESESDETLSENTAVETGRAIESAENAEETADEAEETADRAEVMAEQAIESADEANENSAMALAQNDKMVEAIQLLTTAVAAVGAEQVQMREIMQQIAQNTQQVAAPPPADVPPRNTHWLNKTIGR